MKTLHVSNLGPIKDASIAFGDLTVLVGPQATGKSLFLQLLKLFLDVGPIRNEFKRFNLDWGGLSEFSGNVGDIVARVVSRMEQQN
jgi:predicted ATP-dependent endonuclease of OLD family